jgi:subtilisin family serine protease
MRYDKLSAGLLGVVETKEIPDPRLDLRVGVLAFDGPRTITDDPKLRVFLRCDPSVPSDRWSELGVVASRRGRGLRTASVPLSALSSLSEDDAITQIIAGQQLRPRLDVAGIATNLPAFVSKTGLTGEGVVVGVVDTGIDGTHSAFAGRLSAVWDQTVPGPGVPEGRYGSERLGAAAEGSIDTHGHGTHVASIAAGSDATYAGVAPRASLVVVKTTFDNTQIADAVDYIFRVAGDRPAVVNLSLGGHNNAHDGTDQLSELLDDLTGPGRIICAAAGNEGSEDIHAEVDLKAGGTSAPIDVLVPHGVPAVFLNIWHGAKDTLSVSMRSPAGEVADVQLPLSDPYSRSVQLTDGEVTVLAPPPQPPIVDRNVVIDLLPTPQSSELSNGAWQLVFDGATDGPFHLWVLDRDEAARLSGSDVREGYKVGSPGSAASVITVGAFTTRNGWVDASGATQSSGFTLSGLAPFSSPGPLRNGARKPDLAAPGSMIIGARSADAVFQADQMIDQTHAAMQGTSMSTPFVSGLIALMLERNDQLDPDGAKEALSAACVLPATEGAAWNVRWGAGAIDASRL